MPIRKHQLNDTSQQWSVWTWVQHSESCEKKNAVMFHKHNLVLIVMKLKALLEDTNPDATNHQAGTELCSRQDRQKLKGFKIAANVCNFSLYTFFQDTVCSMNVV